MDRRSTFGALGGAMLAALLPAAGVKAQAQAAPPPPPTVDRKFTIGMIIFDQMTNLDFVGPNQVFGGAPNARIHVIAKTLDPIVTDTGCRVLADTTFADAPELDLIFIGGGGGTTRLMEDAQVLDFLRSRAPRAQWVTSVCTGTLVLGAAGLLRGYRAATHWTAMDLLPLLGAQPVDQRVVFDRNRVTGGGVTAGIDFGLAILARIWGEDVARRTQLIFEYAPEPPFDSGSPRTAAPALVAAIRKSWAKIIDGRRAAATRAGARFG
jgi:cyclohexyl-isocyanide hydratase